MKKETAHFKQAKTGISNPYDQRNSDPTFVLNIPCSEEYAEALQNYADINGDAGPGEFYRTALISALVEKNPKLANILSHCEVENDALIPNPYDTISGKHVEGIKLKFYGMAGEVVRQISDEKGQPLGEAGLLHRAIEARVALISTLDKCRRDCTLMNMPRAMLDDAPCLQ